jgi:ketosteroid isomerase-like protein
MSANTTTAEAEIRELMAGQETAMRTGDVEWLLSRYTADAVSFDLAPPLRHAGGSPASAARSATRSPT